MPKKILIAEDNISVQTTLAFQLKQQGYDVICASNGKEAVEQATQHKPDLILMDIVMPVMDGSEAATTIRSSDETKDIIIIFLTALIGEEDKMDKAFNGYPVLSKSMRSADFFDRIKKALEKDGS